MENDITFESLIDDQFHELYFVTGSTSKKYITKLVRGNIVRDRWSRRHVDGIVIELYDKNGKNRIYSNWYGCHKIAAVTLEDKDKTMAKFYDGGDGKMYTIFTTKDEAYRHCVKNLMEQKKKINAKILKIQEEFEVIEHKPRYDITIKRK